MQACKVLMQHFVTRNGNISVILYCDKPTIINYYVTATQKTVIYSKIRPLAAIRRKSLCLEFNAF